MTKNMPHESIISQMRFPHKLWYLLNVQSDAIMWSGTGRTILLNYRILHTYLQRESSIFKTGNISSFVRQLNLYGFRKVTSHLQDPLCNASNPYMHEYVHDYFQYGRPELLYKITRKALNMKKTSRPKSFFNSCNDQLPFFTPLQEARRALRIALKNAKNDVFQQSNHFKYMEIGGNNEHDITELIIPENFDNNCIQETSGYNNDGKISALKMIVSNNFDNTTIEVPSGVDTKNLPGLCENDNASQILNLSNESGDQNHEIQFLSMPELDPEPEEKSTIELLMEFDVSNDYKNDMSEGKVYSADNEPNTLNCVLPSITNDHNDHVNLPEKSNLESGYLHGEWDQLFSDYISKSSSQDNSNDLKDIYSQISRTNDILNP